MAKYTIELRKVCDIYGRQEVENWFKSYRLEDALTPEQISTITKFNVWSKEKLATMIVDHYFMREIGFETPALFKHYAMVTMNEIMPRYLLQIYTQFLEYDPLSSVDYVEEYTREIENESSGKSNVENEASETTSVENDSSATSQNSGESNSTSNSNTSNLQINNNTPQNRVSKQNLESGIYASSVIQTDAESEISDNTTTSNTSSSESESSSTTLSNSDSSSKSTTNNESKTIEKYTHSMKGDNGVIVTNQYLVREFRELAVSFNEQIIDELNILFMGLY